MRITTFIQNLFGKHVALSLFFVNCVMLIVSFSIGRRKCLPATKYGSVVWYIALTGFILYLTLKHYSKDSQICTRNDYDSTIRTNKSDESAT